MLKAEERSGHGGNWLARGDIMLMSTRIEALLGTRMPGSKYLMQCYHQLLTS